MIYFYNTFHNGDVHHSRTFVMDIMKKLNQTEYFYLHNNNKDVLKDILNLKYDNSFISFDNWNLVSNYPISYFDQIIKNNNNTYINTWIGQQGWMTKKGMNRNRDDRYCSLYSHYELYEDIFDTLSIPIEDIDFYIPDIDFNFVEKNNIDKFVNNKKFDLKILIVNNDPLTVRIQMDMDYVVNILSAKYPNILFILTNKTQIIRDNIAYTNDIININGCDLNEIGYLSKYCEIIVGRPSGPYCFCMIKDNFVKDKTFLTISNNRYDMFYLDSDADMLFLENHTSNALISMIDEKIKKLI